MQQMVWKGCTQWNPAPAWPTSTSQPQAADGEEEQTHHPRVWYFLIKITLRLLNRLPGTGIPRQLHAWRLQDWCMEASGSHRLYRPGEWVPNKHTQAPPSPQSTVVPLTQYFKNSFCIFSAHEKPTKEPPVSLLIHSVLMLGSVFFC